MLKQRMRIVCVLLAMAAATALVLLPWAAKRSLRRAALPAGWRTNDRGPQLVASEPLPAIESETTCPWVPASASSALAAGELMPVSQRAATAASEEARAAVDLDRTPVRVIRSTHPIYTAVAVDTRSDEVFLQDENFFAIRAFSRLDNTPPAADFTEPKRSIVGPKARMEYNCSIYVDPQNGDIYSLSNDVLDTLAIFPHDAQGDVAPIRQINPPHTTFGLAVDEENKELFLTVQRSSSVVVYSRNASRKDLPLRQLIGDRTQIADPHGVVVDPKNNLLIVNNHGGTHAWDTADRAIAGSGRFSPPSITMYSLKASGDTPPLRVIAGPKTGLNWPMGMSLDREHGEIYVANDGADSILVFRETDSGDVAPLRILKGSKTGLKNPTGLFVDAKNKELWVANLGNHRATVYPLTAHGEVAPLRTIRSAPANEPSMPFAKPGAVDYDSKRDQLLTPN